MKRMSWMMAGIGLLFAVNAGAVPVDLSTFQVFPPASAGFVTVSGNNATIAEDPSAALVSLYNDTFAVGATDLALSFDYSAALDVMDAAGALLNQPDSFVFKVNGADTLLVQGVAASAGPFTFDLTPFQGSTLSLEWALVWGGDMADPGLSQVQLSNVDVTQRSPDQTPVPEPATLVLLGTGLLGLVGRARQPKN